MLYILMRRLRSIGMMKQNEVFPMRRCVRHRSFVSPHGSLMAVAGLASVGATAWIGWAWHFETAALRNFPPARVSYFNPITGGFTLEGLEFNQGGVRLRVGKIYLPTSYGLITPALAAESFTLKDVSLESAGFAYRAPVIDVVGASITQKEINAYLDKSASKSFAGLLATMSATSITAPDATIEVGTGDAKRVFALKSLALRDIAAGKAASMSAASGTLKGPSPVDGSFGTVSGRAIDLGTLAQLMTERPPPLDNTIFAALSAEKLQFKTAAGQVVVGRLSSQNLKIPPRGGVMRTLPALGTFMLEDIAMDVLRPKATAPDKWTMKKLTLTADTPNGDVPTRFVVTGDTIALTIPVNTQDPAYKNLVELGYSSLVFSVNAEGNWMPAANDFIVKDLSLRGEDIGVIGLNASLGKVSREFFSADQKVAQSAASAVTVKALGVVIENKGLFERIVAREARKSGRSIDDTRRQLTAATAVAASSMVASTPGTEQVKSALLKFFTNPRKFRANMKTKDSQGIAISTMRDESVQKRLAEQVEISASSE